MEARSGKERRREVKVAGSAPRSTVPRSAPRSVAPSPRHVDATLDAMLEPCRHLGATTSGGEMCYPGTTIRGAEVQGLETQIVSKRA